MAFGKVTLTGASETIKAGWTKFNSLIDDLLSTTAGKGASQIGIADAGSYMSSANVEDALQEIYADTAGTRALADALGEDSSTTTGLTWGWKAGTIRYDNTVVSVSAGTISLTDDATNYIECDTAGSVSRNTTGFTAGRLPMRTVVCASGAQTTSTDKRAFLNVLAIPLPVAKGGTGAATLTDHGILVGSGTGAITPLGAATNGQIPIGSTGADPVLAEIAGTANQITSTSGAGSITLSVPNDFRPPGTVTAANEGLHILDTDASHDLIVKAGSDLTEDRILTVTTGDAARTLTLNGNPTLNDWFNQSVKSTDSPSFVAPTLTAVNSTLSQLLSNVGIAASVGSKTLAIALKGANGEDPSATNPVYIGFRSATLTTGTPVVRSVTGALSVGLSSGSTLGFTAGEAGRLYVWAIDNAGTVELALSRRADTFPETNLVSTTAEGGAGAADSATIMYSATARTNVPCRCLGYIEIQTGATAGEWDNAPTKVQVMGPGVKRTGDIVQCLTENCGTYFSGTTVIPPDDTIPQKTEGSAFWDKAITPTSALNKIRVELATVGGSTTGSTFAVALFKNDEAGAIATTWAVSDLAGACSLKLDHTLTAGTTDAITFKTRFGGTSGGGTFAINGRAGGQLYGGVSNSTFTITEIFA